MSAKKNPFHRFFDWLGSTLAGKPSEGTTEEPKQDDPQVEEPIAEEPKAEQPKTEQPITEQPVTKQPENEQPSDQETAAPESSQETPAATPASQPAKKQQAEPPKKPKKVKSIEELRKEIMATTMKALDALFLTAPNACSTKQVVVWADAGETTFVGFTGLEQEMKEHLAIEKGYEFKKMELREGRPENEKDARKLNIDDFDVFLQILDFDDGGDDKVKFVAKKARVEIFGGRGDLEKTFYELSSEDLQNANRRYYNIGRSEFPNLGSGSYRQNHIVISDTLRPEINGYVSREHARIGFSNNIGFFLQVERGGSRPLSGNRTRIIREEEQIEMEDPMVKEPLQTGDLIELGKHVVLSFTEIKTTEEE